jgi:glycosyltransferase involved in cell wall biosynthesis
VACQNNASTIRDALDSVLSEARSATLNVEILVIDKQSNDNTTETLDRYRDVTLIQQVGRGLANARNEAILRVAAPIVAFCDADDTWASGSLTSRIQILYASPQSWGVTGKVRFVNKTDSTSGLTPRRQAGVEHPGFTPGALLLRQNVFNNVGYFDEDLQIGSDSDWIVRAVQLLGPLSQISDVVLNKGIRFGSLSTNTETYRQEMMLIARRFVSRAKNNNI